MKNLPFEVIGTSRRSLIVRFDGETCYISNKCFGELLKDPYLPWRMVTVPAHESFDPKTETYRSFPETKWIEVAIFHRF